MFKLYNSSAGSGKTTHLVIEYLTLCFKNVQNYKKILAITFTNNATAEMKSRIIETLKVFSFQPVNELSSAQQVIYNHIKNVLSLSDEEMNRKAKELLREILYNYADFSISTIDSFFQRIIRAFALDLGLNLNYNVEIQLDEFYAQTVDLLINRISTENVSLTKRVMEIVNKKMDETGRWFIERDLQSFMSVIYDEKSFEALKALEQISPEKLAEIRKKLLAQLYKIKEELIELAQQGDEKIKSTNLDKDKFYWGTKGIFNCFSKFLKSFSLPWNKYIKEAIEDRERITKDATLISEALNKEIITIYNNIRELFSSYKKFESYTKNITSLMIMVDLKSIMNEIKERDNLFYLQETNFKIFDNIKDEETPYIYEKLGNRYGYFFIDEFQDTSKMQWENLLPLLKNALSQSYANDNETGDVILFGDMKQAIYRFRNGDSSLFYQLSSKEGYQQTINPNDSSGENYCLTYLDTNYRSASAIIDFNNRFFEFYKKNKMKDSSIINYYEHVEQKIPAHSKKREGFVAITFAPEETDFTLEEFIKEKAKWAIEDATSRGYRFSDIAILTTNNRMGAYLGRFLSSNKIPVISSESLLLGASHKINAIIAFMRFILNEKDEIAKLFLFKYVSESKGFSLSQFNQYAEGSLFITFLKSHNIDIDRNYLQQLPLYTLTKEVCKMLSFTEEDAYISAFLEHVLLYETKKGKELVQFLGWWNEHQDSLSLSSSGKIDAVTISTVHKAKGLEYPIVIFPITQYKETNNTRQIWHKNSEEGADTLPYYLLPILKDGHPDFAHYYETESALSLLDNMNLLYVAHTRPTDGMYIITKSHQKKGNYSKELATFIKENADSFKSEEEDNCFYFGNQHFKINEQESSDNKQPINNLSFSDFSPIDSLISSSEMSAEQKKGIMIHDFLSHLDQFPQTLEEIEKMELQHYDAEEQLQIRNTLSSIVNDASLRPYFAHHLRVKKEVTIVMPNGEIRRPDRIVFMPDGEVVVIDYKTGQEHELYQEQIDNYCRLLREMGYSKVSGKLIYLSA